MNNIFASTTFLPNGTSVFEAIALLESVGITQVELGSSHREESDLLERLKRTSGRFLTHNFFPPGSREMIINLGSSNQVVREKSLDFVKGALEFGECLGAELYTVHPGFVDDPISESVSLNDGRYDFKFPERSRAAHESRVSDRKRCVELFQASIEQIAPFLRGKRIRLGVETQGSVGQADNVIFSHPNEILEMATRWLPMNIGVNLNLGHLNLSASVSGFDKFDFVERLKPFVLGVEVSHNEGVLDDHKALEKDGWYLQALSDSFFSKIPVIFEGRFEPLERVAESCQLLNLIWAGRE